MDLHAKRAELIKQLEQHTANANFVAGYIKCLDDQLTESIQSDSVPKKEET